MTDIQTCFKKVFYLTTLTDNDNDTDSCNT